MKKLTMALALGLAITLVMSTYSKEVSATLSQNLLRLHVIANSDADFDQDLKLKVRDRVIQESQSLLAAAGNAADSKDICQQNLSRLQAACEEEIRLCGYNYPVTVSVGNFRFPTKQYKNVTLPAGKYDGVRVVIGSGMGRNWWCVLYPPLCFVDQTTAALPAESQQQLKEALPKEDYDLITQGTPKVQFKFKIVELFSGGLEG